MFGSKFQRKMKALREQTGEPPSPSDHAAMRSWLDRRSEIARESFNDAELKRLIKYDAKLLSQRCVPY